ncbi:hypothetical protein [Streptomonospora wellingtoniae]|uniref:Uncharacterized protein n=1 Tax=Streptomonospora wellingtoniae TaxID=3075544 RepID=A0ABU2KUY8_9ACTN|nr:hypothetical protein [Streptomonospora sp. DSM 45055]MDT0303099.1 hypothetical protein [Streptomonospora sp. DSM 45055]
MSPADDHTDPQNRGAPHPRPHDWLDAYVHHRLAALDPDLEEAPDSDEAPEADTGPHRRDQPPVPEVTAEELAAHLTQLADHYRRRSQS